MGTLGALFKRQELPAEQAPVVDPRRAARPRADRDPLVLRALPHEDIVVYCKSGVRSANAARQLRAAGFTRVRNLTGGIRRWSDEVDPSVPRY